MNVLSPQAQIIIISFLSSSMGISLAYLFLPLYGRNNNLSFIIPFFIGYFIFGTILNLSKHKKSDRNKVQGYSMLEFFIITTDQYKNKQRGMNVLTKAILLVFLLASTLLIWVTITGQNYYHLHGKHVILFILVYALIFSVFVLLALHRNKKLNAEKLRSFILYLVYGTTISMLAFLNLVAFDNTWKLYMALTLVLINLAYFAWDHQRFKHLDKIEEETFDVNAHIRKLRDN